MSLLRVEDVRITFGGVTALDGVGFSVGPGEVFSIIGPNGAGKTTLFNVISGLYRAERGTIRLADEDVSRLTPHELARRGLSRTFQNLQVFFRMTVAENVMVGRHMAEHSSLLSDLLGLPIVTRQNRATRAAAIRLLERVRLDDKAEEPAGSLPYGALKRLEIARALAAEPKVLLLDEPAAGCNAVETEEIDRLILTIARSGVAVVLIEHDMKLVMKVSDRVLVLHQGRPLAEGSPAEVRGNPAVVEAYLGRPREAARARG